MIDLEKQPIANPAGWQEIDRLRGQAMGYRLRAKTMEDAARAMLVALRQCAKWDADSLIEAEWPIVIADIRAAIAAAEAAGITTKPGDAVMVETER